MPGARAGKKERNELLARSLSKDSGVPGTVSSGPRIPAQKGEVMERPKALPQG